jgi:hypothetical protein
MSHAPTRTGTPAVMAAALSLLVSGCGDDGGDGESRSTTTEEATTTSTQPTTMAGPAEGPAEWVGVVRDIDRRIDALYADPDPGGVGDAIAETCACWQTQFDNVKEMADVGWRLEGEPTTVLIVEHESTDARTGAVRLTVTRRFHPYRVFDENDELVQEVSVVSPEVSCVSWLVLPDGPGGVYRVHDELELAGCPDEEG